MPNVVIDPKKCKSCYLCVEACPQKLIKISNVSGKTGSNIVEYDNSANKCTGCALCAISCPDLAITEVSK